MTKLSPYLQKTSWAVAIGSAVSRISLLVMAGFLMAANWAVAETVVATNNLPALPNPLASALPDAGASVFRVFGALVLVIAIFLGGVWLFRNWQRFATRQVGGARLNLIEIKSLGQRQMIYVVGYQQQRMLLASSPAGVTLVSHLPDAGENAPETAAAVAPATRLSFADAFQQVLARKS